MYFVYVFLALSLVKSYLMHHILGCVYRGVVADSEDTIRASVCDLGKYGFINYFGLQVVPGPPSVMYLCA